MNDLEGKSTYYVRRLGVGGSFGNYNDALAIAAEELEAFSNDTLHIMSIGFGYPYPKEDLKTVVRSSIKDPRGRLEEYVYRANRYKKMVESYARGTHLSFFEPDMALFGLYKRDTDELIGYSEFMIPENIQPKLTALQSVVLAIQRAYFKLKYKILDWWAFLGESDKPFQGCEQLDEYNREYRRTIAESYPRTVEELSRMTGESEIAKYPYPGRPFNIHLITMIISPEYQGEGLGQKFLRYSIDALPNARVQFKHDGCVSYGPQKVTTSSTPAGQALYRRFGFTHLFDFSCNGISVHRFEYARL